MWPKVRSPGQFEWPNLKKSLNLHQSYNYWAIDMQLSGVSKGDRIYKTYISDFRYLWPEVRSISRPPHYKSMGEISTSSECHSIHSICSGSWYYRSLVVILPKNVTGDLWEVSLGHPRSPEVTSDFSAITFDWIEIETPFDVYRVCLVNADRMICIMTYFGQVMTLTWGQILTWGQLDLLRSKHISLDAPWRAKNDGVRIDSLSCLDQKLFKTNYQK